MWVGWVRWRVLEVSPGRPSRCPWIWIRVFACRSGLVLADVFIDSVGVPASREGVVFSALVEALRRPHIQAVVVPGREHFSRFAGLFRAMCTVIEVETRADVLVMSHHGGGVW